MDFSDTPLQAAFRAEARAWLATHARPRGDEVSEGGLVQMASHEADTVEFQQRSRAWQRTLAAGGWGAITWPVAYGGRDASFAEAYVWADELAHYDVPGNIAAIGLGLLGPTIMSHGTPGQKDRYLPPMLTADEVWCQLWSEPDAGSDLAALKTRADRTADGWTLNGQKVWTSGAHYSEFGLCIARTDPEQPKHRGLSVFIVDMRSDQISVRPLKQMTGSAHFNEVFLSDVHLPSEALVGDVNDGWRVAQTTLMNERFMAARMDPAEMLEPLLRLARKSGAHEDPLIRQELGRIYAGVRALTLTGYRTTTKMVRNGLPGPETSTMKLTWTNMASAVAALGTQILGHAGALTEGSHGFWSTQYLFAPGMHLGGGTDEVQRNIIGERVLGLPREPSVDRGVPFRELTSRELR